MITTIIAIIIIRSYSINLECIQYQEKKTYLCTCALSIQINEFVKLGGDQLVPYYADILGAILPCISHMEDKIRVVKIHYSFVYAELWLQLMKLLI